MARRCDAAAARFNLAAKPERTNYKMKKQMKKKHQRRDIM